MSCPTIPKTACCFTLVAKQVERNVGAGELYLTESIEGKNVSSRSSDSDLRKGAKMKIGFIGLGIMGSRMAANLQKRGHSLVVFNRTRAKAEPLLGPCGTFSDSPAKLAEQVDVLFTMLAHPDAVEQAALGANGFLDHLKPNSLWVDCSSVNPSFSRKMAAQAAAREIHFVDAPVTGSAPAAAEAKLIFWVGADPADLERIRSLLLCMGNKTVHTGGHGTGASMKMVVNLLLGDAMVAFAEGMALGLEFRAKFCLIHCSTRLLFRFF